MKPLLPVKTGINLSEIILSSLRENGFPQFKEYSPLVRKYSLERVPVVLKTGTDRDEHSSWCCQEHYPNVQKSGLSVGQVTFLNVGLRYSMLYNDQAMSIYDPNKMCFVGGEGWIYSPRKPHSFLDALILVVVPEIVEAELETEPST